MNAEDRENKSKTKKQLKSKYEKIKWINTRVCGFTNQMKKKIQIISSFLHLDLLSNFDVREP